MFTSGENCFSSLEANIIFVNLNIDCIIIIDLRIEYGVQ